MIAIVAVTLTTNAQMFMTGNLSFAGNGGKVEAGNITIDNDKTTSYGLGINGGYYLSDSFAVGLGLGFAGSKYKDADDDDISLSNSFNINPFASYYFLQNGNFKLAAQGTVILGFGGSKYKSGSTTTKGPKETTIGFSISPVAEYAINEHWSITSSFGRLYFTSDISKSGSNISHNNYYGLNASLSSFSLGALYNF